MSKTKKPHRRSMPEALLQFDIRIATIKLAEYEAAVLAAKTDHFRQARLRHSEKALGKIEVELCDYAIDEAQHHPLNKLRTKFLNALDRIRELSGRRETLGLHPFCIFCGDREPCVRTRRSRSAAPRLATAA